MATVTPDKPRIMTASQIEQQLPSAIMKTAKIVASNLDTYNKLAKDFALTIKDLDKIPQNEPLKQSLKAFMNEPKMSDQTLDTITMVMQIVNTMDRISLVKILTAFGIDSDTKAVLDGLLDSIKEHQNYIQTGGDDDDDEERHQIALPGSVTRQSRTGIQVIVMLLALVASLLFVSFGVGAIGDALQGGVNRFEAGLKRIYIEDMPVSPLSEAFIEGGTQGISDNILQQMGFATSEGEPLLQLDAPESAMVESGTLGAASALEESVANVRDFTIPDMSTTERLGLLLGHIPEGYISRVSSEFTGFVNEKVVPVITKMVASATEAAAARAWEQGSSGNLLVRGLDSVTRFFGLGGSLPDSRMMDKALETFISRLQLSTAEIGVLLGEVSRDTVDNVIANAYGYAALAGTSLAVAVLNAASIALRMASTQAQRDSILRNTSALLDRLANPTLYAFMYASEGIYRGIGYIGDTLRRSAPPGAIAAPGQYGGKKHKRTRKHKSHKKRVRKTKNNKRVSKKPKSILKRGRSKKQRGGLKKGTTKRRCVTFNFNKRGGKRTRRR